MLPDKPDTSTPPTRLLDNQLHVALARMTGSLSPTSALLAFQDWGAHLAASPGKQMELAQLGAAQLQALVQYVRQYLATNDEAARAQLALPVQDNKRFAAPQWQKWPFNVLHQSFLLTQQWWAAATHGVAGVEKHHEAQVAFWARQLLDMFSPANQLASNPVVLERTRAEGGANLLRGLKNFSEDFAALHGGEHALAQNFVVGHHVAITPGKVVLRNRLMELIQYAPATGSVHPEPVLITPAWIMKYYILDLSPHNSLIKYLVDKGHTVFCISWKNPGAQDSALEMNDYLQDGFFAALEAINTIVPNQKVHACGYCLGGTLLAIAAAAMGRDGDARLASTTFFAAQTDFTEPGELSLFIDEAQLHLLEAQMQQTGYLDASQMAGAFQMLRSYDLLWSRMIYEYMLGERIEANDLMAWNMDATRMPAAMHSQYLRRLFLNDDLSEGRYRVKGRPVSLGDIKNPVFMVGTVTDHVAPWRSVHKLHYLSPAEITFALTTGGHNAGFVNPPSEKSRRRYQLLTRAAGGAYVAPDEWLQKAAQHQGSWWPAWQEWLAKRSGKPGKPPRTGGGKYAPLQDAPGTYVLEK